MRMKEERSRSIVVEIMTQFADLTGLSTAGNPPRRYLWTDAFGVCNFLALYHQLHDETYKNLALRLVDQVHEILGRHREDDSRTGWISGLGEEQGKMHPTKGGLRIGKKMNERKPEDPYDDRLEWDRDGQYYHYLTKWIHALHQVHRVTGDSKSLLWAIELAKTAHARFTYVPFSGGGKRMYWKMSIDLSYPLVASMGHHDPLDGLVTYLELQGAALKAPVKPMPDLHREIAEMIELCKGKNWVTEDPLGMGGLLTDAYRLAQLSVNENLGQLELTRDLLDASLPGLEAYLKDRSWNLPANYRLAFREFGLAIGLQAVEKLQIWIEKNPHVFPKRHTLHFPLQTLTKYTPLGQAIVEFWLEPGNRETGTWTEHLDINMVMLATSLDPDGYLEIGEPGEK